MDSWARDELHYFEMRGRWGAFSRRPEVYKPRR